MGHECRGPGIKATSVENSSSWIDYEIIYRRGSQNTNVDALSRIGNVSKEDVRSDEFDEDRKRQILYEFHDAPVGGHRGMNETYRAIKSIFLAEYEARGWRICKAVQELSGKLDANP